MPGTSAPSWSGRPDPSRRIRRVRDTGVLGFQDGVGDVRALVGIADDEVDASLDQEPDVAGSDRRVRVPLGVTEHHLADLRVRERLEDGLHPRHLTPDVQPAAVGVPHDDVAAGAGVALRRGPALHRLVDRGLVEILGSPRHGRQDDVPAGFIRRLTAPSAFSINAGSASVLSPNSESAPVLPVAAVAPPPVVPVVVPPLSSSPLLHAAATIASTAMTPMMPDDPDPLHVPPPCGSMALATR